jgi:hypothetical protein
LGINEEIGRAYILNRNGYSFLTQWLYVYLTAYMKEPKFLAKC